MYKGWSKCLVGCEMQAWSWSWRNVIYTGKCALSGVHSVKQRSGDWSWENKTSQKNGLHPQTSRSLDSFGASLCTALLRILHTVLPHYTISQRKAKPGIGRKNAKKHLNCWKGSLFQPQYWHYQGLDSSSLWIVMPVTMVLEQCCPRYRILRKWWHMPVAYWLKKIFC